MYIGRPGKGQDGYLGNPWKIGVDGSRDEVISKFKDYFEHRIATDKEYFANVMSLKDKTLGCFCNGNCHGNIIADYLNNL